MTANESAKVPATLDQATVDSLVEMLNLLGSAKDAMSDDIITRLARTVSEGMILLDRLTRNEGLMRLLQVLDRPEMQYHLVSFGDALSKMSRDLAIAPPAKGGVWCLLRMARQPGVLEGLRSLSLLGQYWGDSLRDLHRRGGM